MDRVVEMPNVDKPDSHTDEGNDLGQLLAKLVQLLLQRRLLLLRGCHLIADLADLSAHTCGNDDTCSLACSNVGALEVPGGGDGMESREGHKENQKDRRRQVDTLSLQKSWKG